MNKLYNIKIMNETEKQFILDNYSNIGCLECSKILGINKNTIYAFAYNNKLKVDKEAIKIIASKRSVKNWENHNFEDKDYNVSTDFFKTCNTPEAAYILGLLWADGTVYKNNYQNRIAIECLESDMNIWIPYFKKTGNWSIFKRKGRISSKGMISLNTNNKQLVDFLLENDYGNKSIASPDKILKLIPYELKHYFFRGWIDGDGCFYFNKKNSIRQFYLSGAFEQNWDAAEYLFNSMNIKYSICRVTNKTSYSCIRVTNKKGIEKIGEYVYNNFKFDNIGLDRKFDKLQEIIL